LTLRQGRSVCDASGRSYALEPVVMHINARSGNFVPGSDADFDRHDMVFEEIIRSRPRRRASPRLAEGFSPTRLIQHGGCVAVPIEVERSQNRAPHTATEMNFGLRAQQFDIVRRRIAALVRAKALPERVEAPAGLERLCRGARRRRAHLRRRLSYSGRKTHDSRPRRRALHSIAEGLWSLKKYSALARAGGLCPG
jgi:hypothetical protein